MKIIAACGNGMGTSLIIKLKVQKIAKILNIDADVEAMSVGQAKSMSNQVDVIITGIHLKDQFNQSSKAKILGLKNLMDDSEIESALKQVI